MSTHAHNGEWCVECVNHGYRLGRLALAKELRKDAKDRYKRAAYNAEVKP